MGLNNALAPRRLFVVLPIYDEAGNLPQLIPMFFSLPISATPIVVAVDDGSRDRSFDVISELSRRFPILTVRHASNQGYGSAIRSGLLEVAKICGDNDIAVTMDADQTQSPLLSLRMLSELDRGADVVIASRYVEGGYQIGVPFHRMLLSRSINLILALSLRLRVSDVTSGYRMVRGSVLRRCYHRYGDSLITTKGFEASFEVFLRLRSVARNVAEVPLILRYDLKKGKSKMRLTSTALSYVQMTVRSLGGSL